jgi:hypothetical protein
MITIAANPFIFQALQAHEAAEAIVVDQEIREPQEQLAQEEEQLETQELLALPAIREQLVQLEEE